MKRLSKYLVILFSILLISCSRPLTVTNTSYLQLSCNLGSTHNGTETSMSFKAIYYQDKTLKELFINFKMHLLNIKYKDYFLYLAPNLGQMFHDMNSDGLYVKAYFSDIDYLLDVDMVLEPSLLSERSYAKDFFGDKLTSFNTYDSAKIDMENMGFSCEKL